MERVQFSTTLSKSRLDNFRAKCKEDNIPMNEVIEAFFDLYINVIYLPVFYIEIKQTLHR